MTHRDDTLTQADNLRFIRTAMKAPMLERDDERNLAIAWRERQDEKALHKLIKSHARLVVALATRFRFYGLPIGDLIQEGHIGLLQAANRFETDRDVRFSTYAAWWIRASIQDYVLRNWSIVRTGTTASQKALFFNLRRLRAKIEGKAHAEGRLDQVNLSYDMQDEIARALKVKVADVARMDQRLSGHDQSLHAPLHEDGTEDWQDRLVDETPNPEEWAMQKLDGATRAGWLEDALGTLDAREKTIIAARHLQDNGATLDELGGKLHISKERVRQLEARALAKLRKHLAPHQDNAAA